MRWMFLCAIAAAVASCVTAALAEPRAAPGSPRGDHAAEEASRRLGRGINLGNALEAPREGDWGLVLEESHFEQIAKAGFQAVRVPIKWSAHAAPAAPFAIEESFFKRVDWVVDQARRRGLAAVLNVHHFDEIHGDPDGQEPRLAALWGQIARRYRNEPETVSFELLNEPNGKLTEERWNQMIPGLLSVIRESNPGRFVIVGPGNWNGVHGLPKLLLPEHDRRIIVTFHYYLPFEFTHQGAPWVRGSERWKGKTWQGTQVELAALKRDFDRAAEWARRQDRPLFLGEFGAYSAGDLDSRARWTAAVAHAAEARGISWAYWEFASGFGAFDKGRGEWRKPLVDALLNRPAPGTANR